MTIFWLSGVSGDWSTASDWQSGVVPTAAEDAFIVNGGNITINGAEVAKSLTISGSYVTVSGSLTLGASLTLDQGNLGTALNLSGGTVSAASILSDSGTLGVITGYGTVNVTGALSGLLYATATGGVLKINAATGLEYGELGSNGATLELSGNATHVYFQNVSGTLKLDSPSAFTGAINGITVGDVIDLAGITANSASYNGSQLTVNESNGQSLTYNLAGAVTGATLTVASDHNGGTDVSWATPPGQDGGVVICFMAGTFIATPTGQREVQHLAKDDLVITHDGRLAPVRWLGRQTVSTRFSDPLRVLPIRIRAGALGDLLPIRDLLVSPDHALLVDELLIHASALVNGTSIVREKAVPERFVYYHVELDDHSLLLAENTPAETFIDNVDRMNFDNWDEHEALYPDGKAIDEMPYPRAKARRQVPMHVRTALDQRANILDGGRGFSHRLTLRDGT